MTATPNIQHQRHRLFPRLRYSKKLKAFLAARATDLAASATGQTVSPLRTTNTKAEAIVVFATNPANNDTLTIGTRTYTFKTALTEVKATGTLTNDGSQPANTDTVVIGGKTYTFQSSLTNVDGHVHIGADAAGSMTNLFHAINGTGGTAGTDYAAATVPNTDVVATNPTGTTVVLTAKLPGIAANSVATTETSAHLSFGAATLTGGIEPAVNEVFIGAAATDSRDNIVAAITAGAGANTKYATGTVAHELVTAGNSSNDLLVTALSTLTKGFQVPLAKSSSHLTLPTLARLDGPMWTATTHAFHDGEGPVAITNSGGALPTGTPTTELWVHVVDANHVAFATSLGALQKGDFIQTTSAGTGTQTAARATTSSGIFDTLKSNNSRTVAAATDIDTLK